MQMTISECDNACVTASEIGSARSDTEVIRWILIPAAFSFSPIHAELVSTICPIRISSPMVMISACIVSLIPNLGFFMIIRFKVVRPIPADVVRNVPAAGETSGKDTALSVNSFGPLRPRLRIG